MFGALWEFLEGVGYLEKVKKWDNEKMKLYICFTADLKIYFIFKKALYYCIYLWRNFLMDGINLAGLPDVGNTEKSRNL